MTSIINPDKLAQLNTTSLNEGSHTDFASGHCAMEVVSWLADEGFTDAPACASPIIRRYVIRLNDRWDDEKRQSLKPFLPRMVGTGSDGRDQVRRQIATEHAGRLTADWLRLAGLTSEADRLTAAGPDNIRAALEAGSRAARVLRRDRVTFLRERIKQRLAAQNKYDADVVAGAVADVVAGAVADVAVDAVAAAAVGAAVDAAVAAAVAAVAAVDAVAAVAVNVDAAVDAVTDAVAAAVADVDVDDWWNAVYRAVREHYRTRPLPITEQANALAAEHDAQAIDLLDRLITA